ncbi:MAG TPA: PP2C family protein-serine/threonine phosphatase [Candidatus Angelobacter sp.]|jgi:serine phosphatase RsbU (regulator of sigma subunit)
MAQSSGWHRSAEYWKTLPPGRDLIFLAGIFCLFFSFGVVLSFVDHAWVYVSWTILLAFTVGFFSMLWAYAGFRRIIWLMVILAPLQLATNLALGRWMDRSVKSLGQMDFSRAAVEHRLMIEGLAGMMAIVAGYSLVVAFIRKEGLRIFTTIAEVKLAGEVHKALVPTVACRMGEFEFYGASVPSGQIGGDLVDVTEHGSEWTAYVADVSGHGVPAGMIMAMVKSAARMGSVGNENLPALLLDLNRVLLSLSAPHVFVTFACISGSNGGTLQFALAGHLPVLHYRKRLKTVEERSVANLPIGILSDAKFDSASIDCEEGDLLAVLTDGLTEAADRKGEELGLEPLKAILLKSAGDPLEQIVNDLRGRSLAQGKQEDDQTVLLVRRGAA